MAALRDAGITAIVAFGLFLPLIGFKTEVNGENALILRTRWPLLFAVVAIVGVGRLGLFARHRAAPQAPRVAPDQAAPPAWRIAVGKWFVPFAIGFVIVYPALVLATAGFRGSVKWIDNFGIQILIYVMLGWGLNIVVGLAGLLDLGYVAFYAVGAYSYALLAKTLGLSFWVLVAGLRHAGLVLGHFARLSGVAAARRLSRHRHPRLRRDHSPGDHQFHRADQRLCRHRRHPAAVLFRHTVQCRR